MLCAVQWHFRLRVERTMLCAMLGQLIYVSIYLSSRGLNAPYIPSSQVITFLTQPCAESTIVQWAIVTMINLNFTVCIIAILTSSRRSVTTPVFPCPVSVPIVACSTSTIVSIAMPYMTSKILPFEEMPTFVTKSANCNGVSFE